MSSNEDYLDSLLKSMGNDEETTPVTEPAVASDPNKALSAEEIEAMFAAAEMAVSDVEETNVAEEPISLDDLLAAEEPAVEFESVERDAEVPTLDSIKDFSEDKIEQMLAATQQAAEEAGMDVSDAGEDTFLDESNADDLLALLGGLSDDEEINEISDLLNKDEQNELVDEGFMSAWDDEQGFVSEEIGTLLGGGMTADEIADKKEAQRQKREEKKLEKQRQKQLKKEERLRKKEGKKQQKEAQKLVEELEQERKAAERAAVQEDTFETASEDEAVGLFEAVEGADFVDIFGAQTGDTVATSDISSLLAELETEDSQMTAQMTEEPVLGGVDETDALTLFGATEAEDVVDLFGNTGTSAPAKSVNIFGEEEPDSEKRAADEVEVALDFDDAKEASEKPEKKKGLFSKLFNALTEEDPEDTISEENKAILDELDEEDKAESKKKKGKKGKADKKKGKDAEDGDEDEEDGKGKGKGAKEKKKPKKVKPKKEKPVKVKPPVYEWPTRRISKKSILVVVLFAATVFAIVYFAVNVLSEMLQLNSAKEAFERQDYVTCYEKMYGLELSEEETEMFKHAELVMKMQRRIAVYEKYMAEEMELEALDSLMRGVASYEELYNKAQAYNAGAEVHAYYIEIIELLEENYGLSQADAIAIAACESNVQYTRYLTALVEGESVSAGVDFDGTDGDLVLPDAETDDILPAEEELPPQNFAD